MPSKIRWPIVDRSIKIDFSKPFYYYALHGFEVLLLKKIIVEFLALFVINNVFLFGQQQGIEVTETFGDRLVIGMVSEPPGEINPFEISTSHQQEIVDLIFGYGLLQKPGKYAVQSSLLDRLIYDTPQANNKVWRVVLNRNIVFQDGSLLLNSDVKFTYDLIRKFGGNVFNRRLDLGNLKNISVEGDLEVKFELYKPDADFYEILNDIPILSHEYYSSAIEEGYSVFEEKAPMGIGPFSFKFQDSRGINLKFHQRYFSGRPFLEDIRIEFFDNEEKLVDALTNKNVDYIEIKDKITAERLHELMGSNIIVFLVPRPNKKVYFILANLNTSPLYDLNVRRAIEMSIKRNEISSKFDIKEGAKTLFDSDNPYYFKTAFRDDEYNPVAAARTLKNAGWMRDQKTGMLEKNGKPLNIKLGFSQNSFLEESIARSLKISLGELGINLQPIPVRPSGKNELVKNGNFDLLILSYTYDPQYIFEAVEQFYFDILKGNLANPNYQNNYLDQLINLSYRDKNIKQNLYQRFQYYLKRELPAFFLFFDQRIIVAVNSRFRNYRTSFREGDRTFIRMQPFENWFVPKVLQRYSTQNDGLE